MPTKEISNFYFFRILMLDVLEFREYASNHLLVGTTALPAWPRSQAKDKYYDASKKDKNKVAAFLKKNNVYKVNSKFVGKYLERNKYSAFLGSDVPLGRKDPFEISKRSTGPGIYFYYKKRLYLSDSKEEVRTYVDGTGTKEDGNSHRERIPDDTQMFVWNRDGGACVKCGSGENLAYDHIIPYSLGGSNSRRNLQLLCDSCNSKKGNKIGG